LPVETLAAIENEMHLLADNRPVRSLQAPPSTLKGRTKMPATMKGPAIFLAQFAGDAPPFNSFDAICGWAAGLGYKGVQIPTFDPRMIDLADLLRRDRRRRQAARARHHRTVDPSAGTARRRTSGL
jgi:hypothetical protein